MNSRHPGDRFENQSFTVRTSRDRFEIRRTVSGSTRHLDCRSEPIGPREPSSRVFGSSRTEIPSSDEVPAGGSDPGRSVVVGSKFRNSSMDGRRRSAFPPVSSYREPRRQPHCRTFSRDETSVIPAHPTRFAVRVGIILSPYRREGERFDLKIPALPVIGGRKDGTNRCRTIECTRWC